MFLTAATLGLFLPFGRVREYRAKAESVRVRVLGGTDALARRDPAARPIASAG